MLTRRRFLKEAGLAAGVGVLGCHLSRGAPSGAADASASQAGEEKAQRVSQPKYAVRGERIYIPMRDGIGIAAFLTMPDGGEPGAKFPVIFRYDPYRGAESGWQDNYFARRGYVVTQVDVRGTGASEGRTTDNEYSEQEGQDALDAIDWLSKQSWCNGKVGMGGGSYGGFNSIQIAMLHPPALKAIVPMMATDDVYTDDVVSYDGALQCESLARWPFSMIGSMALPAGPDRKLDTEEARYRVEHEPWIFGMLREQRNSRFWQRMSLRPNYAAITIPTFMVGGWLDAYTDSIPRMLEKMTVPRRAIIGPWTHGIGYPGPAIDLNAELLRWWDYWLKGIDTGIMDEPMVAIYVNQSYRPSLVLTEVPGSWRSEESWPVARVHQEPWYPQPGGVLARTTTAEMVAHLPYKATVGLTNRYRCARVNELPIDQRTDDAQSLCYTSAPLEQECEILGSPQAILYVSATAPVANWIVRLCDVSPDGTSMLVTKGVLNGTHRDSHVAPSPLQPGKVYRLQINLKVMSWTFPKGHRMRVAVCNADFPNLWPTPYAMTTSLYLDAQHPTKILLPVCPSAPRPKPRFKPPESDRVAVIPAPVAGEWQVTRDEGEETVTVVRGSGPYSRRSCTASDLNPAKAKIEANSLNSTRAGGATLVVKAEMTIESDEKSLHVIAQRELRVNGKIKYRKRWAEEIPRDLL